jgi:hypothetical protein
LLVLYSLLTPRDTQKKGRVVEVTDSYIATGPSWEREGTVQRERVYPMTFLYKSPPSKRLLPRTFVVGLNRNNGMIVFTSVGVEIELCHHFGAAAH